MGYLKAEEKIQPEHQRQMKKELTRTENIACYGNALDHLEKEDQDLLRSYLYSCQETFQILGARYRKKDSMDRAYFAYLISRHRPCEGSEFRPIMELLISFLPNSTVYCKENVLKALYALGNSQAVEKALGVFQIQNWFHHQKLLADGLLTFRGDKTELAARLWRHHREWREDLVLAVVQFITGFSGDYRGIFLDLLQNKDTGLELRLAVFRYFRRFPYEPVYRLLIEELRGESGEDSRRIVAASVLARYPGSETVRALKEALCHPNWYVRYNAASSLVELKAGPEEFQDVFEGDDLYAKEILSYMLEEAGEHK